MQKTKAKQTNNKGITLVALVITIIVLLILAAVGIGAIAGPEGLIAKAKQAAEGYNDAAQDEVQTINELLNMIEGEKTSPQEGITSTEIANNPEEYYGAYVDYTPQNSAPVGWRIFYADSENIYLIADDYVPNTYAPNAADGTAPNKGNTEYRISLVDIVDNNAYMGTVDILQEDAKVTKWISHANKFTTTNDNMKATAYLLDTSIWSGFKDSNNKVEYVIGGPTLELFIASYNDIHETDINYEITNETGYKVKWSTDSKYDSMLGVLNTSESLYINNLTYTKASGYWLASPCSNGSSAVFNIIPDGYVNNSGCGTTGIGLRPIICLKSGTQLVEQKSGKYAIQ